MFLLPTQLGKHFWPDFAFVAGIRVDYLSPTLYLTDVLLLLLFAAYCRERGGKKWGIYSKQLWPLVYRNIFAVLGVSAVVVGVMTSPTPLLSIVMAVRVGEIIFFAFCTKRFIGQARKNTTILAVALLGSIFYESVLVILQFFRQGSLGGIWYFLGERAMVPTTPGAALAPLGGVLYLRAYGTFSHPNVLAGFLLVSLCIVALLYERVNAGGKVFLQKASPLLLLVLLAFVFTLSRIALSLLMVLFFSVVIVYRRRLLRFIKSEKEKKRKIRVVAFSLLVMIITASVLPLLIFRYTAPDFMGDSLKERVVLARAAVQLTLSYPIYGVGLGQFIPSLPTVFHAVTNSILQPVHSIFLLVLSEVGLFGFIGMVAVLYSGISFQVKRKNYLLVLPTLICLLLGIGDHYLLTQQQGRLLLGLSVGILFVRSKSFGRQSTKNTKKD